MEYLRTNNTKTALITFNDAKKINDQDPCVFNEIGVIHYKNGSYKEAKDAFESALRVCVDKYSNVAETIYRNLAHNLRKMKDYSGAISNYEKCLKINPKSPSTYTSLGFTYNLIGKINKALECYHKSSFLKSDDTFTNDLIKQAMEDVNFLKYESE